MFKRILLGVTFVAALGVAGLGISDTAEARRLWTVGYVPQTYYVPSYGYYRPVAYPYRAYYPRVVQPYQYYYGPTGYYQSYYYAPQPSVYFSVGF